MFLVLPFAFFHGRLAVPLDGVIGGTSFFMTGLLIERMNDDIAFQNPEDISIEEFAREMFKAGSNLKDKSPEEIFYQDYKKFIAEGDVCFGVGQISSMDADELKEIKERLLPFMVSECGRHGVSRVYFMLTNIMEQSTELLFYGEGSEEMAVNAFKMQPENGTIYLKGVVSRKKQLIPPLMEAAQMSGSDYV